MGYSPIPTSSGRIRETKLPLSIYWFFQTWLDFQKTLFFFLNLNSSWNGNGRDEWIICLLFCFYLQKLLTLQVCAIWKSLRVTFSHGWKQRQERLSDQRVSWKWTNLMKFLAKFSKNREMTWREKRNHRHPCPRGGLELGMILKLPSNLRHSVVNGAAYFSV